MEIYIEKGIRPKKTKNGIAKAIITLDEKCGKSQKRKSKPENFGIKIGVNKKIIPIINPAIKSEIYLFIGFLLNKLY